MINRLRDLFRRPTQASGASAQVDDSPGWRSLSGRPQDYDPARLQEIYADALEAWRKNPIAWRIIAITTDYIVGDQISLNSPLKSLDRFIQKFWHHPKNRMPLRLESMSDELARAGDLFVALFRNPQDGMSYIRFVTKDRIAAIETAPNDWESEWYFYETLEGGGQRRWLSPDAPESAEAEAVMLHYAVNRPLGALMGESDLTTMIPWLLRYSRMLEDRVRLHWAVRAFLWVITVPGNRVREKQEQYRTPPEAGSIIVKDESERWEVHAPNLNAGDARHDLQAVRAMIDAGSGYPPHWRGDAGDISLATAQAMQNPTERHLLRRQRHFIYILQDILYHAYRRAVEIGAARPLPAAYESGASGAETGPGGLYDYLFRVHLPDISRYDNQALAQATRDLSQAFASLGTQLPALSPTLGREALRLAFKFCGEPLRPEVLDAILAETHSR